MMIYGYSDMQNEKMEPFKEVSGHCEEFKITEGEEDRLEYSVGTLPGQDGGPIFLKDTNQAIAIHSHYDHIKKCNVGLKITERMRNWINKNLKYKLNVWDFLNGQDTK